MGIKYLYQPTDPILRKRYVWRPNNIHVGLGIVFLVFIGLQFGFAFGGGR